MRASASVLDLLGSGVGKGAVGVTYRRDLETVQVGDIKKMFFVIEVQTNQCNPDPPKFAFLREITKTTRTGSFIYVFRVSYVGIYVV